MLVGDVAGRVIGSDGGLADALGVHDARLARVLGAFGLDDTCAVLIPWIPAIELAWLEGLTRSEHERLRLLIRQRHPALSDRAVTLLKDWLRRRPSNAFFRTARRAIRAQLQALPPDERPALRARILGPCVEVGEMSGGVFGFPSLSTREQAWLEQFAQSLQDLNASVRQPRGGVS